MMMINIVLALDNDVMEDGWVGGFFTKMKKWEKAQVEGRRKFMMLNKKMYFSKVYLFVQ